MALPGLGRITGLVTALALGAVSLTALPGSAPANAAGPEDVTATNASTVTLITGDRVTTWGDSGPAARRTTVQPGPGREGTTFSTFEHGGHLYVIPSDAAELVSNGTLDERLFDVTTLRESDYADAASDELPLLVSGHGAKTEWDGTTITQALPSIAGSALNAVKSELGALWESVTDTSSTGARTLSSGIDRIWLDGKRSVSLDRSAGQIGAPKAWKSGVTGKGVTVAVLDSGVDQTHPDLKGQEIAQRNFSDADNNEDHAGHGTHVAGTVAGTGGFSHGKYRGIAHGAKILDGKVLDDDGFGKESAIIAGLQWATEKNADIANLSLGGSDTPRIDPLEKAVNDLSESSDTLFVIAAGNDGPSAGTVGSPGSADAALTVGAVNRKDGLAEFSSRGPRVGDGAIKPDITAPGVGIVAALHSDGTIGKPVDGRYTALDGTSMATPHIAGAAALLAQAHPKYGGSELKSALTSSARPNPELTAFQQGSGQVDVPAALDQSVTTGPTNLSFGVQRWPHDDDKPVTRELTYHNHGDHELTLDLSSEAKGPDGQPAPAEMFTVDRNQVVVPAGGSATVRVTADTSVQSAPGGYSGAIVATNGQQRVRTPMAVTKEVESYDLTVDHTGPKGNPTSAASTYVLSEDLKTVETLLGKGSSRTIRLPKGHYMLDSTLNTGQGDNTRSFKLFHSGVDLTKDTRIDLDFRRTKPVDIRPPKQAGELLIEHASHTLRSGGEQVTALTTASQPHELFTGHVGPPLPPERLDAAVGGEWSGKQGSYHLAWLREGKVPSGLRRSVEQRDLATVRHEIGPTGPDRETTLSNLASRGRASTAIGTAVPVPVRGTHTSFYNTDDGVRWTTNLTRMNGQEIETSLNAPPRGYQPGREYRYEFNHAPFGPGFPETALAEPPWAWRQQNQFFVTIPLYTDGGGNAGFSSLLKGRTTLHRDGELIGRTPEADGGSFSVPADAGRYRLSTEATLPEGSELSRKISASWTFESAPGEGIRALPLSAVRFQPELNGNSAPAGQHAEVPVFLQNVQGQRIPAEELTVQVSYDGGKTWTEAPVLDGEEVALDYPDRATTVSLRARARDQEGNTVDQTVINAYRLRR